MNNADQPTVLLVHQQASLASGVLADSPFQIIECHVTHIKNTTSIIDKLPDAILIEGNPDQSLVTDLQIQFRHAPLIVLTHNLSLAEQFALADLGIDDVIFDYNSQAVKRRIAWQLRRSKRLQAAYSPDAKLVTIANLFNYMQSRPNIGRVLLALRQAIHLQRVVLASVGSNHIELQEFAGEELQPIQLTLDIDKNDQFLQLIRAENSAIFSKLDSLLPNAPNECALIIPYRTSKEPCALIFLRSIAAPFTAEDVSLFELFTAHFRLLVHHTLDVFPVNRSLIPLWQFFLEASSLAELAGKLHTVLCEHRKIHDAVVWINFHSAQVYAEKPVIQQALLRMINEDTLQSFVKEMGPDSQPLMIWKAQNKTRINPEIFTLLSTDCVIFLPIKAGDGPMGLVLVALKQNQFPDETDLITIENQIFTAALAIERLQSALASTDPNSLASRISIGPDSGVSIPLPGTSEGSSSDNDWHSASVAETDVVATTEQALQLITVGNLMVNLESRLILLNEKPLKLTRIEYELLSYLATKANRVVNHEELLQRVWGPEFRDAKQYLWVTISRLRKKLQQSKNAGYIYNRPGIGYMLRAPSS